MSCDCPNIECIDVFINDCTSTVTLPIQVPFAGTWRVMTEFNGVWIKQAYVFDMGDNIVVENTFNSDYAHKAMIYDEDMNLLNDTCYYLNMKLTIDATGTTPPQPATKTVDLTFIVKDNPVSGGSGSIDDPRQIQSGNTITITDLIGNTVHNPVYLNEAPIQAMPYNPETGTFDNTANGGFINNDIFTVSYEKDM